MMAYRWLTDLDLALSRAGIPFREVGPSSLDPTGAASWRTRGRPASTGPFDPTGVLCHHTASPAGTSTQAELNVILAGNAEAPGPISTLLIARDATVHLIAAGRCNHGGRGKRPGIDAQCADMNGALLGIEAANNGIGEPWPDAQCEIYARVVAALADHYGWPLGSVYLHATTGPPSGGCNSKIDPAGPWARQPNLIGSTTWDLGTWRQYVADNGGSFTPPPTGEETLTCALIIVDDAYAKFQGDLDAQGVLTTVRWMGARLNGVIGFQPDNVTPRLPGTQVLHRKAAQMIDFTLVGPVPTGDKITWTPAHFYQGG